MADLMTIEEKLGGVTGKKIAWFGDYNNVAKTFAQAAGIWDFQLAVSCPEDLKPKTALKNVTYIKDAQEAASDADVVVTDTWVSMGQEGKNIKKFEPYQVNNADLMKSQAQRDLHALHADPP
jgi:ornithine carbamoyltransferase